MKILALDSSSKSASVALSDGSKILGEAFLNTALTHSETLVPMIDYVLKSTRADIDSIDYYAVTVGPGSFTGVRIGVAAVKGICQPTDKRVIPVSTLEAIAFPFRDFDGIVCAVMDARCNQVYCAAFKTGERLFEDDAVLIDELCEKLVLTGEKIIFAGDGASLVYEILKEKLNCVRANPENEFLHASSVCLIAEMNFGKALLPEEVVPEYLRLPQAQRELNNKMKENLK